MRALRVVAAAACAACAPADAGRGFTVRDSAGVTIAESSSPAWRDGEGWRVEVLPVLRLGAVEGDSAYLFSDISSVLRLADGRVVVADRATRQVRWFTPDGRFLRASGGRRGRGPGEFEFLRNLDRLPGDSLLAWDPALSRVSIIDPEGAIVRTVPLHGTGYDPLGYIHRLSDGRYLGGGSWSTSQVRNETSNGLYRPMTAIYAFAPGGAVADTIVVVPGADMMRLWIGETYLVGPPIFARQPSKAVRNDTIYVATADALEVRAYTSDGTLTRRIRGSTLDLSWSDADLRAEQDAQLATTRDTARLREMFDAMPLPPQKPAHERMLLDAMGNIWLEPYVGSLVEHRPWTVFAADGRLLGEVLVPEGLEVLEIGEAHVVGVWRDALDVEHVHVHRITRSDGGSS